MPTIGGSSWHPAEVLAAEQRSRMNLRPIDNGPVDQRRIPPREDLLRFRSDPLPEPLHIHGEPQVELWLGADVADTAVVVTLVDEHPDGTQALLRRRGMAARRRAGTGKPDKTLVRGKPTALRVDLGPLSYTFQEGHRVSLHVAPSSWPAYRVHPNVVPNDDATAGLRLPAYLSLFHDRDRPSALVLPIVPAPPTRPRARILSTDG